MHLIDWVLLGRQEVTCFAARRSGRLLLRDSSYHRNSTFNVTQRDALLFTTSIGFDLSCYDIFGSLSAGSTIHFWPGSAASPDQLFEVLVSFKISFWDSAPQVLQQLEPRLAEAAPPLANDLRLVFLSGDWVPISLVQSLLRAGPGGALQVVALGGATEVTVWSNYFEVPLIDADWPSIPYGRPIWNHQYYCLGQSGPVHVGTTGELYIGGVGVAQGYIGRPDLTAERFLPNSFHSGRMYRTGDMVRFMPLKPWGDPSGLQQFNASDVVLEFLGRVDSQVKVRGYRVELAEVELAFLKQPGIETASVLALPSGENAAGYLADSLAVFQAIFGHVLLLHVVEIKWLNEGLQEPPPPHPPAPS